MYNETLGLVNITVMFLERNKVNQQFIIFVDPYIDTASGTKLLTERIDNAVWKSIHPELVDNDINDTESYEGVDEFLGYSKALQCCPDDNLSEEQLISFCREVISIYSKAGYKTVVAANFEDKV